MFIRIANLCQSQEIRKESREKVIELWDKAFSYVWEQDYVTQVGFREELGLSSEMAKTMMEKMVERGLLAEVRVFLLEHIVIL